LNEGAVFVRAAQKQNYHAADFDFMGPCPSGQLVESQFPSRQSPPDVTPSDTSGYMPGDGLQRCGTKRRTPRH